MSTIVPSIPPSHYTEPTAVSWSFGSGVGSVAFSLNGTPPAISEYIAYDTLNPPNPFIAVTQDGRGNVIYDGGFPKFYNSSNTANNSATSFAGLNPAGKYLYNALNFCANPIKVLQGNRKVLLVGDAIDGQNYAVKSTTGNGFRNALTKIVEVAGYDLTIKDRGDWNNSIDADINELDEYCLVILMSSWFGNRVSTDRFVDAMVTYRERGNGIILITDHGPVYNTIDQAIAGFGQGFFATAQPIAVRFGAFFSGDYDRTPVNVGFLRSTYGDHPLYNNLSNAEDIPAGGSESRVVVTEITTYTPSQVPSTSLDSGRYEFNFLTIGTDGTPRAQQFVYTVGGVISTFFRNRVENQFLAGEYQSRKTVWDLELANDASVATPVSGELLKNDVVLGSFSQSTTGSDFTYTWNTPDDLPPMVREGDRLELRTLAPEEFRYQVTVSRPNITVQPPRNLSELLRILQSGEYVGVNPYRLFQDYRRYLEQNYNTVINGNQDMVEMVTKELITTGQVPERGIMLFSGPGEFAGNAPIIPENVSVAFVRTPLTVWVRNNESFGWEVAEGQTLYLLYVQHQRVIDQHDNVFTVAGPDILVS